MITSRPQTNNEENSMLSKIIENFLKMNEEASKTIMKLLALEGRWQQAQKGISKVTKSEIQIKASDIKTQADLVTFLQFVGQSHWFKGHDRSKFPVGHSDKITDEDYFTIFESLGLFNETPYDRTQGQPHFSVILGSSESQVTKRVNSLKKDLVSGLVPKQGKIFGLGCNRGLGVSVIESEASSKQKLAERGEEQTEMKMVNLITAEMVDGLKKSSEFKDLTYHEINTASPAKTREDKDCVTTAKTAISLKSEIERDPNFSTMEKPIRVAVFSNQPFVERQRRDIEMQLGDGYQVIGVGSAVSDDFKASSRAFNLCLGELARLINISYNKANIELLNKQPLTDEELLELETLFNPKTGAEKKTEPTKLAGLVANLSDHYKDPVSQKSESIETTAGKETFISLS